MCEVKHNYSIIVRTPGEMRAALYKYFTPCHYNMNRQAPVKNLSVLIKGNYCFDSTIVDPLKGGGGTGLPS